MEKPSPVPKGVQDKFLLAPLLPHKCGVPPGYGTPNLCGSEELCRAPCQKGVIKSGCGLSSRNWGQECPQNPQAGKPALRSADIPVCGFGRLSSRQPLTHF